MAKLLPIAGIVVVHGCSPAKNIMAYKEPGKNKYSYCQKGYLGED
jgi:hypothetical protein